MNDHATPEKVYHEFMVTRNLIYSKYAQGVIGDEEFSKMMTALYNVTYDALGVKALDTFVEADRLIHEEAL